MSFKVEFKSNYLFINYGSELFLKNDLDNLKKLIINHPKKHIILDLLNVEEFQEIDPLVSFQLELLDQNLSFIIVITSIVILFC